MPARYPSAVRRQVVELARAGTRVAQLAETFGMTETMIYNWINQEKIDRGEVVGQTTDQALELAAAKRRIRELETELASRGRSMRSFSIRISPQKPLPGDRVSDRAGNQRQTRLPGPRRIRVWLLRLEGQAAVSDGAQAPMARGRDHGRAPGLWWHLRR